MFRVPSGSGKSALTSGGAGFIGNYSDCTFRVAGTGTFKPLVGTDPFIGEIGQVEEVAEYRLETVVPAGQLRAVMKAMLAAHPLRRWPMTCIGSAIGVGCSVRVASGFYPTLRVWVRWPGSKAASEFRVCSGGWE